MTVFIWVGARHDRLLRRPPAFCGRSPRNDRKIQVIANTAEGGVKQSICFSAKEKSAHGTVDYFVLADIRRRVLARTVSV